MLIGPLLSVQVLCLAAVALARPQEYAQQYSGASSSGAVTTVTERTFTIRGEADNNNKQYDNQYASGVSSYSAGASGVSQPGYSFETVATAQPAQQESYAQNYQQSYQSAPAYQQSYQQSYQAAPAYQQSYQQTYQAAPAYQQSYQQTYQAAPAVAYQAAYQAAPAVAYQAAPAVAYQAAPAIAYQAAPAVAYQAAPVAFTAVTAAPAVSYQAAPVAYQQNNYASSVGVRSQESYDSSLQQSQVSGAEEKIYKHVYAFAAPEEPAVRASVRVQAPVNKKKHYKLVFIKAPQQQTVVDSDITLPAQEEEKTLIYVLSKNQKQVQPEIRIKQAQSSKHAKPEVFFLKYKNEQEAQAIASGAISGQSADVPAQGEIISDGSVSILGKSSGASSFGGSSFGSSSSSFGSSSSSFAAPSFGASNFGSSSLGSSVVASPSSYAAPSFGSSAFKSNAGTSGSTGFSFGSQINSGSFDGANYGTRSSFSSYNQEPASVAIKVTQEPVSATASSLSL
ncbi:zinc finger RNA-binding protein-like [Frankliniella occidentalis]|uniref:Zinc finger RNA-binding protein-like n=1 Tax=Frankliniella occidentalis TaxID=133901 RepID=A0A6J1SHI4_FRAOC|nr:zinc finger RNA-binding protein-like [Frankliniella occidentalis]